MAVNLSTLLFPDSLSGVFVEPLNLKFDGDILGKLDSYQDLLPQANATDVVPETEAWKSPKTPEIKNKRKMTLKRALPTVTLIGAASNVLFGTLLPLAGRKMYPDVHHDSWGSIQTNPNVLTGYALTALAAGLSVYSDYRIERRQDPDEFTLGDASTYMIAGSSISLMAAAVFLGKGTAQGMHLIDANPIPNRLNGPVDTSGTVGGRGN